MKSLSIYWTLASSLCALVPASFADEIFYDETWAGPVRLALAETASTSPNNSSPNATTWSGFNTVEATFVMPRLSIPKHPSKRVDRYTAASWIGLDGFVLSGDEGDGVPADTVRGLWQAGVFMTIWDNGTSEYTGFYEW